MCSWAVTCNRDSKSHDYSKTIISYIMSRVSQQSHVNYAQEGVTKSKIDNNKGLVEEYEIKN